MDVSATGDVLGTESQEILDHKALDIVALNEEISSLRNNQQTTEKLISENSKLQYRISILEKRKDELKLIPKPVTGSQFMGSVKDHICKIFQIACAYSFPNLYGVAVNPQPSSHEKFGDYQVNVAMTISQSLKQRSIKLSPRDVANQIVARLPQNNVVEKYDIAGPGFINIWVKKVYISELLADLVRHGVRPPFVGDKKRVAIDFSSPNIAKEMHVGHLRSTIIGESISRLMEFVGHDTLRLNHIGDWGTQFGMLIAHLEDKFPDYVTTSPPIEDLQSFYKEAKVRFDEDESFKARAQKLVVKLQNREEDITKAWNLICDVSRKQFEQIYKRLNITVVERGESFYQERMGRVVEDLDSKGMLKLEDGRKILFTEDGDPPLTLVKTGGGYTYDTSDMATLRQRVQEEYADWLIYVVDVGQSLHFQLIYSASRMANKKKFKTRSGETVKLSALLDEGLKRSEQKLLDKGREADLTKEEFSAAAEAVAYGCIKYADLSHCRSNDYVFSFDKMLDDKGNTAAYLLYALTRIRSISRNAGVSADKLVEAASRDLPVPLSHEKEFKLAKKLLTFPDVITKLLASLMMHHLCDFLYELSTMFTEFYDVCYCIEKDQATGEVVKVNLDRLLLCEATATVMQAGFDILGIKGVSKM